MTSRAEEDQKNFPAYAITFYLRYLSTTLVGRSLSFDEHKKVLQDKIKALPVILNNWMSTPYFATSFRLLLQSQLSVNGSKDGINFNLPGNLAQYLVKNNLPYSTLLTADYCIDDAGAKVSCDTGAPYNAGVLTTRAYMASNASRFNLRRARKLLDQFACSSYPMSTQLQAPIPKMDLLTMFQEDQEPNAVQFGNGTHCYTCHSQFGAHAQFFVKFDSFGKYQSSATGEQDPSPVAEPGRSTQNLFTSHLSSSSKSSEASQMFGQNVNNLQEASQVMINNPLFLPCAIRNIIQYYLRLQRSDAEKINGDLLKVIKNQIEYESQNPTVQQIVLHSLTNPYVIESVLQAGENQ